MDATFTDTHCHIHEEDYVDSEGAYERALQAGVMRMNCVGTSVESSRNACLFARTHEHARAIRGIHPHDAQAGIDGIHELRELLDDPENKGRIVGIGEIGLDYFYEFSPREKQQSMLRAQLDLAVEYDLPVSFHVRDAELKNRVLSGQVFMDFWPLFDSYNGSIRGVLHSFTDTETNMKVALEKGLFIGVNGIATFARDKQALYRAIPLSKILLETDAPFLTPEPLRGSINEPAFVRSVASFIANLHSINLSELSLATEKNANIFH